MNTSFLSKRKGIKIWSPLYLRRQIWSSNEYLNSGTKVKKWGARASGKYSSELQKLQESKLQIEQTVALFLLALFPGKVGICLICGLGLEAQLLLLDTLLLNITFDYNFHFLVLWQEDFSFYSHHKTTLQTKGS